MLIHGLQKMTLLDFPEHIACTVFLGGCDFRCPYCHNFELVDGSAPPLMDDEKFFKFLEKRHGLLDGVAITGGEPLLRTDIAGFIRKIRTMGFKVKLDTNGYHPERLQELCQEGLLDYVAMDIKNSIEKYGLTAGIESLDTGRILKSISIIMTSDIPYEFRTTVVHELHSDEDFTAIGEMIKGASHYYLQQYTERDTVPDKKLTAPSGEEMERYLGIIKKFVPNAMLRGL
ncbi:MAG: anaerobic ribonucleoside-triphosphate reductase activating protein [Oribacterium sp.]|nr:anaerobic ribonucleoside-triphosphate reductase activating protein [Oribacterium sp.]